MLLMFFRRLTLDGHKRIVLFTSYGAFTSDGRLHSGQLVDQILDTLPKEQSTELCRRILQLRVPRRDTHALLLRMTAFDVGEVIGARLVDRHRPAY